MPSLSFGPCAHRSAENSKLNSSHTESEILQDIYQAQHRRAFVLGGYRQLISAFEQFSEVWQPKQIVTVLNLEGGRGDWARALKTWGKKNKFDLRIISVDGNATTTALAKETHGSKSEIFFECKAWNDASYLQAQQVDYVISGDRLHRFKEEEAIAFLKKISWLAKKGFVVVDGVRDLRRWMLLKSFSWVTRLDPMIQREVLLSTEKAFSVPELKVLLTAARLDTAQLFTTGLWSVIQSDAVVVPSFQQRPIPAYLL